MRGFVFTIDALIAFLIIIAVIGGLMFFRSRVASPFIASAQLHFMSEDVISVLSNSKLSDAMDNKTLLQDYISMGVLNQTDLDKKTIDVIGALWSSRNISEAANITKDILDNFIPKNMGYEFLIINSSGIETKIYESGPSRPNHENSSVEISSKRIVSGYDFNKTISGYVARAFINSIRGKNDSSYLYFGGYVGDGNITANITLPPIDTITEAYLETSAGGNFTLYINGVNAGTYNNGTAGGGLMRADKWVVCNLTYNPSYCSNIASGNNTLNFNFSEGLPFIGGGYFRVTYNTTQMAQNTTNGNYTHWFPGVRGFFNLYDSFYVPGTLTNITSYIHYFNNITLGQINTSVYLNLGNNRIFTSNQTGEQMVILNYSDIWQNFSTQQNLIGNISNNTIPLRFGIEGFQLQGGGVGMADAVLVTDVSGSMGTGDVQPGNQQRLAVAKTVDSIFVNTVLNTTGDRVGLVSYSGTVGRVHSLSSNNTTLQSNITAYSASGSTCLSCGIDNATKMLTAQSLSNRFRGILIMSDGYANQCLLGNDCGDYGTSSGSAASNDPNYPAKSEAINMSCVARSKNYTVFSVGFGSDADNITLQRVACWNCSLCSIGLMCNQSTAQASCVSYPDCSWTPPANNTLFHATFDGWSTSVNCTGSVGESWNDCRARNAAAYWRATAGTGAYNASSAQYLEASNIDADNSTWVTKCLDLRNYSKSYVTFWYNKTSTVPANNTLFHATFDGWSTATNCTGASAEGWNECRSIDAGAYWRATAGTGAYNASSAQYHQANSIINDNSTWVTKCMDLSAYTNAYATFWYNKTSTSTPGNITLFHATFDSWNDGNNCDGASAEGWNDCVEGEQNLYWAASASGSSNNASSTQYLEGNDIDTNNATWITKCMDLSQFSKAYATFWYNKTSTNAANERQFMQINKTGTAALSTIWNSSTSATSWTYKELNITDYISSSTCIRYMPGAASSGSEELRLDDFKIIGTGTADNKQFIMVNRTGAGNFVNIWSSTTAASPWTYQELNITSYVSNYTCLRYMVGLAPSASEKMMFDDFKIIGTDGVDENQFIMVNRTGAGNFVNIWSSTTAASPWTYQELNITDYKSASTCVRYMVGTAPSANRKLLLDDFKITGTLGGCDNNFSSSSPCWVGNVTLPNGTLADCRSVRYGQSNNVGELEKIYGEFGNVFAILGYTTQIANITGNINMSNVLYPDSRIEIRYNPIVTPFDYGEVSLTRESPRLKDMTGDTIGMPYKEGWLNLSDKVSAIDAKITSYSSNYWTENLWVNSSITGSWRTLFNLTRYGIDYTPLGDPFIVNIPVSNISSGNNSFRIGTAIGVSNKTGGSPDDVIIYTIKVKGSVGYGSVNDTKEGAETDAIQRLIDEIKGYVNVTTDDIETQASSISNVPSMWGPASVRVSMWV